MSKRKGAAKTRQPVVTTDSSSNITVTVKTLKQKEKFDVAQSITAQEFKEEVAKRFKTTPDLLVLIFAGKVLKDQDTLSQQGVHCGVSIYVIIRSQQSNSNLFYSGSTGDLQNPCLIHNNLSELLTSSQDIVVQIMTILTSGLDLNTVNNNLFLLGFLYGWTAIHLLDMLNFIDAVREQDVSMHSLISEIVQTIFVQNILGNDNLTTFNPQIRQLAEENPQIHQILTNAHTIREMLEVFSSPALRQEVRNLAMAKNHLVSIPGGYRALEQLYRFSEKKMSDIVQAQMSNNLFASLDNNPPLSGTGLPAHTENRMPLPNPWVPVSDGCADDSAGHLASSSAGDSSTLLRWGLVAAAVVDLESMDNLDESDESEDDEMLVSDEAEAEGQMEMEAPQTRFKTQMEQLSAMGFQDQNANLQALIDAEGDINAAVKILTSAPSSNKRP